MLFHDTSDNNPTRAIAAFQIRLLSYQRALRVMSLSGIMGSLLTWLAEPSTPHQAFFVTGSQLLAIGSTVACLLLWSFCVLLAHQLTKPQTPLALSVPKSAHTSLSS